MHRQNPAEQLALPRHHQPLVFERIVPAFADQFRNVFLRQKILVEPPNLREHLQVGEVLSLKIFLRALRRFPRPVKFLPQFAVPRIAPDYIHRIRLKQILQRKPPLPFCQVFRGLRRNLQKRVLRLARNIILNLRDQRGHQIERLMHLRELVQQLHHPVVVFQSMEARPGQTILPRHQVFVERLVLVPQDDNSQLGHDFRFRLIHRQFFSLIDLALFPARNRPPVSFRMGSSTTMNSKLKVIFFDVGNTLLFPNRERIHAPLAERGIRARWRAPARSGMPNQESVRWNHDWDDHKERQPRPRFLVDVLLPIALRDRTKRH